MSLEALRKVEEALTRVRLILASPALTMDNAALTALAETQIYLEQAQIELMADARPEPEEQG